MLHGLLHVKGSVVFRRPLAVVGSGTSVIGQAAEVLLVPDVVVVLRSKLIRPATFHVLVAPVVIVAVTSMVALVIVLVIRPLAVQVVGPVIAGIAVGISVWPPVVKVMVLVPVLVVGVVPLGGPVLAAVVVHPLPLAIASICVVEGALVVLGVLVSVMRVLVVGWQQVRAVRSMLHV